MFDILLYLSNKRLKSYWYETGTPGFLIKLIKEKRYEVSKLDSIIVKGSVLERFDLGEMKIKEIMYQIGLPNNKRGL